MTALALLAVMALSPSSTEDQIRSRYELWDDAYFAHDVKRLAGLLHSDFTLINGHGKVVTRQDYVARLWKSELPEVYETSVLRLKVSRGQATAWTLERNKKAGNPVAEHRYEDKWRLTNGRWMLLQSKTVGGH